ncbi:MAG: hypothetical protein IJK79_03225 [Bacteroidales bacterium]|nr:hypothetical protein [Bacteroidales bacterium]
MRKTVHLCLSSHDEVLFRSKADLAFGFNCFALASLTTESRALAEGRLSTHHHSIVQADSPRELMFRNRNAYSRYFNTKYKRKGRLGEKHYFLLEIEGLYHTLAALNYVNRQGLHHGLAATPFDYPHCSANAFFQKQLGKDAVPELLRPSCRHLFLPSNVSLPEQYRMDDTGMILPKDVLDTAYVEELYISPRNYLYQMNRNSNDARDIQAQKEENHMEPVTLEGMEAGVPDFDPRLTKTFEQGKVNYDRMTDMELCQLVDERILPKISSIPETASVYDIPFDKRTKLYDWLWQKNQTSRYQRNDPLFGGKTITEAQLSRCLCMKYDPKR